jgi:uncharacterized membrane protein HdeD (DUF308 family)
MEAIMERAKPWYLSKTVWGGIVAVIAGILSLFGKEVSPELQRTLTEQAVVIASGVASIVGGIVSIYGRFKADKRISL